MNDKKLKMIRLAIETNDIYHALSLSAENQLFVSLYD